MVCLSWEKWLCWCCSVTHSVTPCAEAVKNKTLLGWVMSEIIDKPVNKGPAKWHSGIKSDTHYSFFVPCLWFFSVCDSNFVIANLRHLVLTQDKIVFHKSASLDNILPVQNIFSAWQCLRLFHYLYQRSRRLRWEAAFDQWKNSSTVSSESSRDHLVDPAGLLCWAQME